MPSDVWQMQPARTESTPVTWWRCTLRHCTVQRHIANREQLAVRDLAQILRDDVDARAARVNTTELPAWIMRFLAPFSAQMK